MRYLPIAAVGLLALAGCAPSAPTASEIQIMQSAPKPSNPEAAQAAVQKYFENALFDAPAARWKFPFPPIQGSVRTTAGLREFGWFMCGELNGKSRMGGYDGWHTFIVYFLPTKQDVVIDGSIDRPDDVMASVHCLGLYKT
jgi:hypothetical protein